ncbi:ankyrin repeat-containing domain protein [Gorgonomyces haynaldii]|nr:ankyrin repeat-containing domain protein [Gorgonomyces haynaldii]
MLDFGAWVNCPDANMLTPIFHAATAGSSECVLRLLIAKADTEVFDDVGKGPIHQAALNNFDCIVALLIDFGCNLHATNVAGNTPLHVSAARNLKESVKWLLMRGADPSIKNKSGKTALDLAVQANSVEAVELLNNFHAETVGIRFQNSHSTTKDHRTA